MPRANIARDTIWNQDAKEDMELRMDEFGYITG